MTLTKSEYLLFLKHPSWLWLKKYDKTKIPELDANTQVVFDAGHRLEAYAEQLFSGGHTLGFNNYNEYLSLPHRTKQAKENGHTVLFQARYEANNLTCITDIVEFTSPSSLNLYEVKSGTKVKEENEFDLAFQLTVLESCGYTVDNISIIHVDGDYIRHGDIQPSELLKTVDVTEAVKARREATAKHIASAFKILERNVIPDISPRHSRLGCMKEWVSIFRTLTEVPEMSIYDLTAPSATIIGELEDLDVVLIKDIPNSIKLTDKQARQVAAVKAGAHSVDIPKIKEFLSTLTYPLYFFDYETCKDVIPPFDGVKPHQQVTSQYSLHILEEPGGDIRHTEFIHRTNENPAHSLAASLRKDIGDTGTILVWYEPFEKSRNTEMAEMLPEYTEFFTQLNDRVIDLMTPFSEGYYVDPRFLGSASIKKVLPVLVPELSYKELEVQEGQTAQRLWMEAVLEGKGSEQEKEKLFQDLLTYCELDTLAMVRIYERLLALTK